MLVQPRHERMQLYGSDPDGRLGSNVFGGSVIPERHPSAAGRGYRRVATLKLHAAYKL